MAAAAESLSETLVELEEIYFASRDSDKKHQRELHRKVQRLATRLRLDDDSDLHQMTEVVDRVIEQARGIVNQAFSLQVVELCKQVRIASGLYIFVEIMANRTLDKIKRINTKCRKALDTITEEPIVLQEDNEAESSEDSSLQGDLPNGQSPGGSSPQAPSPGRSPPSPPEVEALPDEGGPGPHRLVPPINQPSRHRASSPAALGVSTDPGEQDEHTSPHQAIPPSLPPLPEDETHAEPAGPAESAGRAELAEPAEPAEPGQPVGPPRSTVEDSATPRRTTRVIANPPNYRGLDLSWPRRRKRRRGRSDEGVPKNAQSPSPRWHRLSDPTDDRSQIPADDNVPPLRDRTVCPGVGRGRGEHGNGIGVGGTGPGGRDEGEDKGAGVSGDEGAPVGGKEVRVEGAVDQPASVNVRSPRGRSICPRGGKGGGTGGRGGRRRREGEGGEGEDRPVSSGGDGGKPEARDRTDRPMVCPSVDHGGSEGRDGGVDKDEGGDRVVSKGGDEIGGEGGTEGGSSVPTKEPEIGPGSGSGGVLEYGPAGEPEGQSESGHLIESGHRPGGEPRGEEVKAGIARGLTKMPGAGTHRPIRRPVSLPDRLPQTSQPSIPPNWSPDLSSQREVLDAGSLPHHPGEDSSSSPRGAGGAGLVTEVDSDSDPYEYREEAIEAIERVDDGDDEDDYDDYLNRTDVLVRRTAGDIQRQTAADQTFARLKQDIITAIQRSGLRHLYSPDGPEIPYIPFEKLPRTGIFRTDQLPLVFMHLLKLVENDDTFLLVQKPPVDDKDIQPLYIFMP